MALKLVRSTKYGTTAEYWKIYRMDINTVAKTAKCFLAGYINAQASNAYQPIDMCNFSWSGDEFPFNNSTNNMEIAYSKIMESRMIPQIGPDGNPIITGQTLVVDENGNPVMENQTSVLVGGTPIVNEDGSPVLDEFGHPMFEGGSWELQGGNQVMQGGTVVMVESNEWANSVVVSDDIPTIPEDTGEIWQQNKSAFLKQVENIYIDFLTNDWTPILRQFHIIAPDKIITVDNTDSYQNMTYLMTLRFINKPSYYNMAGEFERLKAVIEGSGGIMSYIRYHP